MLIKFKAPDPRAGMVVQMDSNLGQQMIDRGSADAHKAGADDDKPTPVLAPPPAPAAKTVAPISTASIPAAKRGGKKA